MRSIFVVGMLAWMPAWALACSCAGTASIEKTIHAHPILIEGRVVAMDAYNTEQSGRIVRSVTLEVRQIFKGSIDTKTIELEDSMCYQSLSLGIMALKHTYVLPLSRPFQGRYSLAPCARTLA